MRSRGLLIGTSGVACLWFIGGCQLWSDGEPEESTGTHDQALVTWATPPDYATHNILPPYRQRNMVYCVSNHFNPTFKEEKLLPALAMAMADWEAAADVKFTYLPSQDDNCFTSNLFVKYIVVPWTQSGHGAGPYYAAVNDIQSLAVSEIAGDDLATYRERLRHELGHTLGFQHNFGHPDGPCPHELEPGFVVTQYDAESIMGYLYPENTCPPPQVGGLLATRGYITDVDREGAQSLYGIPREFLTDSLPAFQPAVTSWGPGRLDVVVVGWDNQLYHQAYEGGQWHGWESLGGYATSAPAVATWGPGRLDVVVRGADNALHHQAFDDGQWHGWESLGGRVGDGTPAAVTWGSDRFDVFVRWEDEQLYQKTWDGQWQQWEPRGGWLASGVGATSFSHSRIDVFAVGVDQNLYHQAFDGGQWYGWENLEAPTGRALASQAPAAATWHYDHVDVFVQDTDGDFYRLRYSNGWGDYHWLGHFSTSGIAATNWGPGRSDILLHDASGYLAHSSFQNGLWRGTLSDGTLLEPNDDLDATVEIVSDWNSGYCAQTTVKNHSPFRTNTWKVVLDVRDSEIINVWDAQFTADEGQYEFRSPSHVDGGAIDSGMSTTFGFCANKTGPEYIPMVVLDIAANCFDGLANFHETDVDCGGLCDQKCPASSICAQHTDCQSGICSDTFGIYTGSIWGTCVGGAPPAAVAAEVIHRSEWNEGYCVDVVVTNTGSDEVFDWTVELDLHMSTFNFGWNFHDTVAGTSLTMTPLDWNSHLAPGMSAVVGFCGIKTVTPFWPTVLSATGN